jgi:hypothetical protein
MLDHWVYLANAGLFLWVSDRLARVPVRLRFVLPAAAAVLIFSSGLNSTKRDTDLKIYEHAARKSSSKPLLYNLAREYYLLGRAGESRALLEKITAREPENALYQNWRWRAGKQATCRGRWPPLNWRLEPNRGTRTRFSIGIVCWQPPPGTGKQPRLWTTS